jgi:hypothetical protein
MVSSQWFCATSQTISAQNAPRLTDVAAIWEHDAELEVVRLLARIPPRVRSLPLRGCESRPRRMLQPLSVMIASAPGCRSTQQNRRRGRRAASLVLGTNREGAPLSRARSWFATSAPRTSRLVTGRDMCGHELRSAPGNPRDDEGRSRQIARHAPGPSPPVPRRLPRLCERRQPVPLVTR